MKRAAILVAIPALLTTLAAHAQDPPKPKLTTAERLKKLQAEFERMQKQAEELKAKVEAMRRMTLLRAAAAKPLVKAELKPEPLIAAMKNINSARRRIQLVRAGAGTLRLLSTEAGSPLMKGDFEDAVKEITVAHQTLAGAANADAALPALEAWEKALMKARGALAKQEAATKKSKAPAAPATDPAEKGNFRDDAVVRTLLAHSRLMRAKIDELSATPMLNGDYGLAVRDLDTARKSLRAASDFESARRALDNAGKALVKARAELWKLKDSAAKRERR